MTKLAAMLAQEVAVKSRRLMGICEGWKGLRATTPGGAVVVAGLVARIWAVFIRLEVVQVKEDHKSENERVTH